MGATALFGEKYGEKVRVVTVTDFSMELCGGTHVTSSAEIGLFKILSETGIGAGVRRIEAVTGLGAYEHVTSQERLLAQTAAALKTRPEELLERTEALNGRLKELERELAAANTKTAKNEVQDLLTASKDIEGLQIVVGQVTAADMDGLRSTADLVRDRLKDGVIVLGAVNDDKVNLVAMAVGQAVAKKIHAGNIVKAAAKVAGGGGGGRPDMAQAGGKLPEKIAEALAAASQVIEQQLQK